MKSETESMYSNQFWNLIESPEWIKPIRYKWIYKKKRGADKKVKTFKAQLVVKGFTQKERIDYEEMLKSIWNLLSNVVNFGYEI